MMQVHPAIMNHPTFIDGFSALVPLVVTRKDELGRALLHTAQFLNSCSVVAGVGTDNILWIYHYHKMQVLNLPFSVLTTKMLIAIRCNTIMHYCINIQTYLYNVFALTSFPYNPPTVTV